MENSRIIKFRAWNGKKMFMNVELTIDGWVHSWGDDMKNIECVAVCCIHNKSILKQGKVMQYTELKDKNGKEDYISDLVKVFVGGVEYIREIYQSESGAYCINLPVMGSSTIAEQQPIYLYSIEHEVVGNIFENKNLIK